MKARLLSVASWRCAARSLVLAKQFLVGHSIGRRPEDRTTPSRVVVREVVVAAVGRGLLELPLELRAKLDEVEERAAPEYQFVRRRSERALSVPAARLVAPLSVVVVEGSSR